MNEELKLWSTQLSMAQLTNILSEHGLSRTTTQTCACIGLKINPQLFYEMIYISILSRSN